VLCYVALLFRIYRRAAPRFVRRFTLALKYLGNFCIA
jgi:hypothetical protein